MSAQDVVSKTTQNFFEKYGRAATIQTIVGRLLKFNKFGEYRAGQEEEQIDRGTELAAYMGSLCTGYVRWSDNRPVEMVMGPVGKGFVPPPREKLGYLDKTAWDTFDDGREKDPWAFTNTIALVDRNNQDFYTFSTSSRGGIGAIGQLALKYGERIRQKPDEMPIITLEVGSYQHSNRRYGEIRYPIFKIVGWIPARDLPPIEGGEADNPQLFPPNKDGSDGNSEVGF